MPRSRRVRQLRRQGLRAAQGGCHRRYVGDPFKDTAGPSINTQITVVLARQLAGCDAVREVPPVLSLSTQKGEAGKCWPLLLSFFKEDAAMPPRPPWPLSPSNTGYTMCPPAACGGTGAGTGAIWERPLFSPKDRPSASGRRARKTPFAPIPLTLPSVACCSVQCEGVLLW